MRVAGHHHDGQFVGCRELLALHGVRRSVEPLAPPEGTTWGAFVALIPTALVYQLRELIAALDRRIPQRGRAGEASIARDAAALRASALQRLAEVEE